VLAGGIGAAVEDAAKAGDGGGVDDDAALLREEDLREGFAREEEGAFDVDAEDVVELLLGGGDGVAGDADAGVVAEDVESAEEADGFGDEVFAVLGAGDVALEADGLGLGFLEELDGGVGGGVADVGDGDLGAFAGEGDRSGLPDALSGAGDEDDFVLEAGSHMEGDFGGWGEGGQGIRRRATARP